MVCSTPKTVASRPGIILMLSTDVGINFTSASVCWLELSITLSWAPVSYLTGDCSTKWRSYGNYCTGVAWRYAPICEAHVVSVLRSFRELRRCPGMVESDINQKVDGCRGPIAWPLWSSDLTPKDFFSLWGHLKNALCSLSEEYQRRHGMTSGSYDNGWCQHVKACAREYCTVHVSFEMDEKTFFNSSYNYEEHMVWSLIACAIHISGKLSVTGRMLYNIFHLFFSE